MSEELNKEKKAVKSRPDSFDKVTDGLYNLDNIYNQQPKKKVVRSRDEELRIRAEKLRRESEKNKELEMQAIREDIERRYSLQLEDAQSKNEPQKKPVKRTSISKIMPEIDEREVVREELEHIDSIINDGMPPVQKKAEAKTPALKKKKKKKAAKPVEEIDLSEENGLYAMFYSFGNAICMVISTVFGFLFDIIKFPFKRMYAAFSDVTENTKNKINNRIRHTLKEIVHFRREIRNAFKIIKSAIKKPLTIPKVLFGYFKKAFNRHNDLLKTVFNYLLPVAALAVFFITVNYWNGVTFALEVIYNGQSLGYISDEAVYIEAKELVKERLDSGAYASENVDVTIAASPSADLNNAQYSLSLVSLDELNDAQAISDKMIENSVDNLTHACGIYVDGEFICAVKNEADAKTVFNDYLAPYEAEAQSNNYVVSFAETIDYVQGLYRDKASVIWDAARLTERIKGSGEQYETHIVISEDTLASIADSYDVSEEYIRTLNPGIDWENIKPGEIIKTKKIEDSEKLVSIKKIITSTSVRAIEFETVTRRDATKYSGYRQVTQDGVNGSERVIKTQVYIDGVLEDTEYDYETIKEPVDEIVVVGTKTSYNGVYIGSASKKGFLWPAPSCHYVSSAYGWRSRGWHKGIDLVKSGGGALGTPVIASRSGRVEVVQRSNSGYGNMILINHGDGYKTRYAHLVSGSMTVSVGDYVDAGQTIGKVGSTGNSTGPHLHFEVIYNGETYNPANYIY